MRTYDIVIIGAGSVGVPLSYYCACKGLKVAVLEKHPSWGRGQNRAAIGGLRATHSDPAKIQISQLSLEIMRNMRREHGFNVEWHQGGYLFVAYDEERERAFRDLLVVQKAAGLDIDWIPPDRVLELSPGLNPRGLRGGTYSPGDGFASPLITSTVFHKLAMDSGVDFRFGEEVAGFGIQGAEIRSLRTSSESYSAGLYVNAAGAEASTIGNYAGLELPVRPDCHEGGVTEPVQRFMEPMIVDMRSDEESSSYYFYQARTGQVVFCITPNPQIWGMDRDNTSGFLPLCVRRMVELYPRLRNLKVRRTWRGSYPMTPDGLPIVGYPKEFDNFLLAVGMCGQGFMLGPGLGQILAEVIADDSTDYDGLFDELTLYRRFEGMELLK